MTYNTKALGGPNLAWEWHLNSIKVKYGAISKSWTHLQYFLYNSDLDKWMPESQNMPIASNGLAGRNQQCMSIHQLPPYLPSVFCLFSLCPQEGAGVTRGKGRDINENGKSKRTSQDSGKRGPKKKTLLVWLENSGKRKILRPAGDPMKGALKREIGDECFLGLRI